MNALDGCAKVALIFVAVALGCIALVAVWLFSLAMMINT